MSFAEPDKKRPRDVTSEIRDANRPLKTENFHSLILGMMKGSNEHRTEAETRVQDVDDLMLVKFQQEVLPYLIVGIQGKILSDVKRGSSITSCSLKWTSIPYYSVEQGATHLDLSQSGKRTDILIQALKREFPKMEIQSNYKGPIITWAGF